MFGDLDWPLNALRGLSAIAEFLVLFITVVTCFQIQLIMDYRRWTQVVILFSGILPLRRKKMKFCSWNFAFYCILSNNPTLLQISCLYQHATNVETVPQIVSIRNTFTHKKPRYQTLHGAIGGCRTLRLPWIRHCPQCGLGWSPSRLSRKCLWYNNLTLSDRF